MDEGTVTWNRFRFIGKKEKGKRFGVRGTVVPRSDNLKANGFRYYYYEVLKPYELWSIKEKTIMNGDTVEGLLSVTVKNTDLPVKTREESAENFTVKPGRGYGLFTIYSEKIPSYTIEVFNSKQEKVYQSEVLVGLSKIDLSAKPKGKYAVRICFNDGVFEKEIELK